ncbi:MAG: DUF2797 domain-containing protein [Pseudomonadota bacterium]
MKILDTSPVSYQLPLGDQLIEIDKSIGQSISLSHTGNIFCIACGRKSKKSFSQGHCFPCFRRLASCDLCVMKPETCHHHLGTCRDENWAQTHCMTPHYVYLANSSGLKVGITRENQLPTRWFDQGASQGIPMFKVSSRRYSGMVEHALKGFVSDRTDWRKMLKGGAEPLNLSALADELVGQAQSELERLNDLYPDIDLARLDTEQKEIEFPVESYPEKVISHNLDKSPVIEGRLDGIKGQYLIFDSVVINMRKYAGYELTFKPL